MIPAGRKLYTPQRLEEEAAQVENRIRERDLRAEMLARRAELNRKYRAEQKRQADRFNLGQFFKAQNARIAKSLQRSVDRVNEARWGGPESDTFVAVTRRGTTEVSAPIKREYMEQRHGR